MSSQQKAVAAVAVQELLPEAESQVQHSGRCCRTRVKSQSSMQLLEEATRLLLVLLLLLLLQ